MAKEDLPFINTELPDLVAPLLQKMLNGELLSGEEQRLLEEWKGRSEENKALFERLGNPVAVHEMLKAWHEIEKNRELNKQRGMNRIQELLRTPTPPVHQVHFLRRRPFRYAAAALLLLSAGTYFYTTHQNKAPQLANTNVIIAPGREGAILTLADGSQVVLDSLGNGVVANQSGVQVLLQNGQLAYDGSSKETVYNTITTPKGRQFRLQLPDGSKVWLNAASSVKYPTTFAGKERRVELTGEAYFEVAKNADHPFKVKAGDATEVEVLGTSFNINSYPDETTIRTTLLDGAVRLNAYQQSQILKPGQQAVVKPAKAQLELVNNADLDKVMAWKNGLFNFEDASLEEVMRQLERWYDIEVTYAKGIPAIRFGGEINRQNTLQDVLQILEKSNVHFRFEDSRKLVVIP
ncbi:DUF4974 domain-containing protein [Chitinophaga sp. SYP-B3965]|uniref:FecR family protein n=1 Tax=Chitinophaga sp. SYP-B3965 TaxID=2663120 RepID=UPI0012999F16|nr:FecR family protein [Chitinophaga sp. SYP-B3965]MRG45409.1 DUF4974 domain-containing protein [Chitinophaga sp. SYP-B3965]